MIVKYMYTYYILYIIIIGCYLYAYNYTRREAKSIKEAVELACQEDSKERDLKWYLAMTDSIVGTIQCADGGSTELRERLDKVYTIIILLPVQCPQLTCRPKRY